VGVRTQGSAALRAFPGWARALGLDGELKAIDIPLDAPGDAYRKLVACVRASADVDGVVVTAHKARLFKEASADIDELDEMAALCREISVIRRDGDRLIGSAIEPRSVGCTLREMIEPTANCPELLVFGAGGTATAILAYFYAIGAELVAPKVVHVVDVLPERAAALRDSVARWSRNLRVETPTPAEAVSTMKDLRQGSLIVNASGLGKDRAGSPVPLPALWPRRAVVWDLNYRGDLAFLMDAKSAATARCLQVHDGWRLFLHGWSEALGCIRTRRLSRTEFDQLERVASVVVRE
jgi:shikimate 5-dehydrogenase